MVCFCCRPFCVFLSPLIPLRTHNPCSLCRELPRSEPVAEVVRALRDVTSRQGHALAAPSFRFVFPVLKAVLSCPSHTPLHDEALTVVALHCAPGVKGVGVECGVADGGEGLVIGPESCPSHTLLHD